MYMKILKLLVALQLSCITTAIAVPSGFTYQGRIFKANGTDPLEAPAVTFKIQIRSPDSQCILYEETHTRDMTGSNGNFTLIIGEGVNTNTSPLSLIQTFDNSSTKIGAASCSYTPSNPNDFRRLRFTYDDGSTTITLIGDQTIHSVPYALNAGTLDGASKNSFIQVNGNTTQARVDALASQQAALSALAAGTSSQYIKAADLPMSSGVLAPSVGVQVSDSPAAGNYAINKNYSDANMGGHPLDLSGLAQGKTLTWDATLNKWIATTVTVSSNDVTAALNYTPLNKSGDTFGGTLNMNNHNITNTGFLTMAAGKYIGLGSFDASAEANLIATTLTPGGNAYAGATWYNSVTKSVQFWDGAQAVSLKADLGGTVTSITAGAGLSGGTITSSGSISLPNVGSTGTFTKITTDTYGRVSAGTSLSASDIPAPAGDLGGSFANAIVQKIQGVTISNTLPTAGQVLAYNSVSSKWEPLTPAVGVTNVTASSPLSVSNGSSTPAISLQSGTSAGQSLIWSGATWSNGFPNANQLRGVASAQQIPTTCTAGQVWTYQTPTDTFACTNIAISSSQVSGLGSAATLTAGTGASNIVQLDSSSRLPAVDGSQLTNLNINVPFKNVQIYSTAGVHTWTVPSGVTKIFVEVWGAGGGGSGGNLASPGGMGGGSGAYGAWFQTVVPSTPINLTVGTAGNGGTTNADGASGGATIFNSVSVAGGQAATTSSPGAAVAGPVGANIVSLDGAAGTFGSIQSVQTSAVTVLGISVLGSSSISGLGGNGGSAPNGGQSGSGSGTTAAPGLNGGSPGAGGGGGGSSFNLSGSAGGKGGTGRVVIWY